MNSPTVSVTTAGTVMPRVSLVSTTVAPGMAPPWEARTVPDSVAVVSCALAPVTVVTHTASAVSRMLSRRVAFILDSPLRVFGPTYGAIDVLPRMVAEADARATRPRRNSSSFPVLVRQELALGRSVRRIDLSRCHMPRQLEAIGVRLEKYRRVRPGERNLDRVAIEQREALDEPR